MKPEDRKSDADNMFELFEKAIEGKLSQDEGQRLDALVANDAEARKAYLEFTHLNACLHWNSAAVSPVDHPVQQDPLSSIADAPVPASRLSLPWFGWIAALAAGIALVAVGYYSGDWNSDTESSPVVVATLTETNNCSWGPGLLPTERGSQLTRGDLNLVSGIAKLRFVSGAEVILEAPAELKIVDAMHCVLKNGTLLGNVPPEAHGFVVDTQTAQLIDRGTSFGVSVNRKHGTTDVNVFDGVVDVEQHSSRRQKRLTEGQRTLVDADHFEVVQSEIRYLDEDSQSPSALADEDESVITVSSADGDGKDGFVRSHAPDEFRFGELLLVSNTGEANYSFKTYLAFDLKDLPDRKIENARLQLQIQRFEGWGFGSFVPDATFAVYGVTDDGIDDWLGKTLTWNNAPANAPGAAEVDSTKTRLLGRFVIPQGKLDGFVSVEGSELSEFISDQRDQVATIVIVRETAQTQRGGLVHAFAGRNTPESSPPTLLIDVK